MPIIAECHSCGQKFQVGDNRAGTTFECRKCGAAIRVPGGSAPQGSARQSAPRRESRSRPRTRALTRQRAAQVDVPEYEISEERMLPERVRRRASTGEGINVGLIAGIAGGLVGLAVLVFTGKFLYERFSVAPLDSMESTGEPVKQLTPAEQAAKDLAYRKNLERTREQRSEAEFNRLVSLHGKDKVVSVVVSGVPGDAKRADKYLHRKIFQAAYADYAAAEAKAEAETARNKEQAENEARANSGGGRFGPMIVWYRYKRVRSDLPYPTVRRSVREGGTFTYHAFPAINPQEFANRLAIGSVAGIEGRKIRISAQLPDPVPDPDVEELTIQYGTGSVVKLNISGAIGDPDSIEYFLEREIKAADPTSDLRVAGAQALGNNNYEIFVAPVTDLQIFSESVKWGVPTEYDDALRTIDILADLPVDLPKRPTASELAEIRRREAAEEAKKPKPTDKAPKEGEDPLDWAIRIVKGGDRYASKNALLELHLMKVNEERLEEVSKLLIATVGSTNNMAEHLKAMLNWRTDETEKAILRIDAKSKSTADKKALMDGLVGLGTPKAAEALASGLADFWIGEDSVSRLIEIGPVAEPYVLRYIMNKDAKVRIRAYRILSEIGGEESLKRLRPNLREEREAAMRERVKATIGAIADRMKAEEAAEATEK